MKKKIEKNPIKIIWASRKELLPISAWMVYIFIAFFMVIVKFAVPDNIIDFNLARIDSKLFIQLSITALTLILGIFTFGKEIFNIDDLGRLFQANEEVYYSNIADYLFSAFLWLIISIISIIKFVIILNFPEWLLDLLRLQFLAIVILATFSTMTLIVRNVNRLTIKVKKKAMAYQQESEDNK